MAGDKADKAAVSESSRQTSLFGVESAPALSTVLAVAYSRPPWYWNSEARGERVDRYQLLSELVLPTWGVEIWDL